ncbi:MAG: carbohydrate ABC transporter permease [Chloroflexi bacterium]|nr:carbohydrate ABC transporter permease [Chloroflexota bacterium]
MDATQTSPVLVEGGRLRGKSATGAIRLNEVLRGSTLYLVCLVVTFITIFPFLWMLSTSFKLPTEATKYPPEFWPNPITFQNYPGLFRYADVFPFHRFILHSTYIALVVTVGRTFFSALAGFAFARLRFPGADIAFGILMIAFLMPPAITMIPLYTLYQQIGWLDTHWPLIVPGVLSTSFGTFLMRQFFKTIPGELVEAARTDGAGWFRIFWVIMVPLSKPALAALAIFSFQATWNDFYTPFLFINSIEMQTLQVGLRAYAWQFKEETLQMAGGVLALLPVMALYFSLQKYFVQGITLTGIKG